MYSERQQITLFRSIPTKSIRWTLPCTQSGNKSHYFDLFQLTVYAERCHVLRAVSIRLTTYNCETTLKLRDEEEKRREHIKERWEQKKEESWEQENEESREKRASRQEPRETSMRRGKRSREERERERERDRERETEREERVSESGENHEVLQPVPGHGQT